MEISVTPDLSWKMLGKLDQGCFLECFLCFFHFFHCSVIATFYNITKIPSKNAELDSFLKH